MDDDASLYGLDALRIGNAQRFHHDVDDNVNTLEDCSLKVSLHREPRDGIEPTTEVYKTTVLPLELPRLEHVIAIQAVGLKPQVLARHDD